ncbi:MAG: hypothetical protein KBB86_01875 [Candidatus Pacebacteria bacterium]|nr:hypothetical protein [Candidatus Paceibacterota bacterium]
MFVPKLLIAVILFFIGWYIATIIGRAFAQVISALKIDHLFRSAGIDKVLERAGTQLSVGGFIGAVVKWFIIVVFLMTSLQIVGLTQVNDFLRDIVMSFVPQVLIAALVLILGSVLAEAAHKLLSGSAKAANVKSANMIGTIAFYAIWVFALIIALSQLGIAPAFMQILFTGIVFMLALAGGLSFGLGGKESAARALDRVSNRM